MQLIILQFIYLHVIVYGIIRIVIGFCQSLVIVVVSL